MFKIITGLLLGVVQGSLLMNFPEGLSLSATHDFHNPALPPFVHDVIDQSLETEGIAIVLTNGCEAAHEMLGETLAGICGADLLRIF